MDLLQFQEHVATQEKYFREVLKHIFDFNKPNTDENNLAAIKSLLCNIVSPNTLEERKVHSGFVTAVEGKDQYVYILHTFEMMLSVIVKSWIKIDEVIDKPIIEYTEEEAKNILSKLNVMLLDKINTSDEFLIEKIDELKIFISELIARNNEAGKKLSLNERYSPIFDTINSNLVDFGVSMMSMSFMVGTKVIDSMKELTGDIPEYVKHVLIVDNIFNNITVLDIGIDVGVEENGDK